MAYPDGPVLPWPTARLDHAVYIQCCTNVAISEYISIGIARNYRALGFGLPISVIGKACDAFGNLLLAAETDEDDYAQDTSHSRSIRRHNHAYAYKCKCHGP